jgi:hypothetical protein
LASFDANLPRQLGAVREGTPPFFYNQRKRMSTIKTWQERQPAPPEGKEWFPHMQIPYMQAEITELREALKVAQSLVNTLIPTSGATATVKAGARCTTWVKSLS